MKVMNVTPFFVTLVLFILSVISQVSALSDDETELFSAIRQDDPDIVRQLLLEKSVDINVRGKGGQTPLMHAVLGGMEKSVKVLLEEGADVTIGENDGYTPMHGAGFQGRAKIAKMLIDHGLDPLDMHEDGYIGMHRSCWGGAERHAETVQVFLDAGVPYDIESKQLKTCMDTTKNSQTLEVLKKAAASLKDGEGEADAEL